MWFRLLIIISAALVSAAIELSGSFGEVLYFNFVLAFLIIIAYRGDFFANMVFAAGTGLILDFYSLEGFGFFFFLFIITALAGNLIMTNFFGSRNWLSFLLFSLCSTAGYGVIYLTVKIIYSRGIGTVDFNYFFRRELAPMAITFVALAVGYFVVGFMKERRMARF